MASAQGRHSAAVVTRSFYTEHFRSADRMFFSRENVRRERRWFTTRLYKLMLYELQREEANKTDEDGNAMKPYISGDVFTNSESPPQVFRIGRSIQTRTWATVVVDCYWNDNTVGKMRRKVIVRLVPHGRTWLIDNLVEEDGRDLITDFSRPVYFSE
ncbi:MAG: hypothetical protein ABI481_04745 [Pyrinomonadaceae bacterium]